MNPDSPDSLVGEPPKPLDIRRYLGLAAFILVGLIAAFYWLGPVLSPFLLGALVAYVGAPGVARMQAWRVPRPLGALAVIAFGVILMLALIAIVLPLVQKEISAIRDLVPSLLNRANSEWLPALNQQFGLALSLDTAQLKEWISQNADDSGALVAKLARSLQLGGMALVGFVVNALLMPVVAFYLLRDWPSLTARVFALVPRGLSPTIRGFADEIDRVLAEFLRGQLSVMALLAVYYCIALKLAGLSFWLPVGLITGLLVFIPYLGFGLGFLLGMVAALTQFSDWHLFAILGVYGVGQMLEGFVLTPWLVGERVGLHPLAVLFALLAFGHVFGFVGVLVALPASAVLLVLLRHGHARYQASALYQRDAWNN